MNEALKKELKILTSRASGPGGQHVNKTESRVELHWNLYESEVLSEMQKKWLKAKIGRRLTDDGVLILISQKSRSQIQNREDVVRRFLDLIERSIEPHKKRVATKPSKGSVERRIKAKKQQGEKKKRRGESGDNEE